MLDLLLIACLIGVCAIAALPAYCAWRSSVAIRHVANERARRIEVAAALIADRRRPHHLE